MGKVLSAFGNGFPGGVTRSIDNIIISMKNVSDVDIPFGAPVFISSDRSGVVPFDTTTPQEGTDFVGFAVRDPAKTPNEYPNAQFTEDNAAYNTGVWKPGEVIEILVRGAIALKVSGTARRAGNVYIRKTDGVLSANAGSEGSTVQVPNAKVRNVRNGSSGCVEVQVLSRNLQ